MTGEDVLKVEMRQNDAGAKTIKEYLIALLRTLWKEQEGFSGKRPFGNSSWSLEMHKALICAGAIEWEIDKENDWIDGLSKEEEEKGNSLINLAIEAL